MRDMCCFVPPKSCGRAANGFCATTPLGSGCTLTVAFGAPALPIASVLVDRTVRTCTSTGVTTTFAARAACNHGCCTTHSMAPFVCICCSPTLHPSSCNTQTKRALGSLLAWMSRHGRHVRRQHPPRHRRHADNASGTKATATERRLRQILIGCHLHWEMPDTGTPLRQRQVSCLWFRAQHRERDLQRAHRERWKAIGDMQKHQH